MTLPQMARELALSEEAVMSAYRYWERKGLVRRIADNPPAFRIIDPQVQMQKDFILCADLGITVEPECIDFMGEQCWYSDVDGEIFNLIF